MTFGLALKTLIGSQHPGVMAEVTRHRAEALRNTNGETKGKKGKSRPFVWAEEVWFI